MVMMRAALTFSIANATYSVCTAHGPSVVRTATGQVDEPKSQTALLRDVVVLSMWWLHTHLRHSLQANSRVSYESLSRVRTRRVQESERARTNLATHIHNGLMFNPRYVLASVYWR
jgi:hypothetical protein